MLLRADIEELIDTGALSFYTPPPLVNRCKCGRRISDNRIACKACAEAAWAEMWKEGARA